MAPTIGSTWQALIERVAYRLQSMDEYTAGAGGSTTTINAAALWQPNNYYQGMYAYISATTNSGAPFGEERPIAASSASAHTLTMAYAFSSAVNSGATFQVYKSESHAAIGRAVNEAIKATPGYWWQTVKDETLATIANTWSYALSGLSVVPEERFGLYRVSWRENTTFSTYPYKEIRDWSILWNGATPTLQFGRMLYPSGKTLRLEYIASPSPCTAVTDKTGVDDDYFDNFVIEYALAQLLLVRLVRSPEAQKPAIASAQQKCRDEAERIRKFMSPRRKPAQVFGSGVTADTESSKWLGAYSQLQ